jgi:hypothetical protein
VCNRNLLVEDSKRLDLLVEDIKRLVYHRSWVTNDEWRIDSS